MYSNLISSHSLIASVMRAGSPFIHSVLDGRLANAVGPGLDRVVVAHKSTSFNVFTTAVGGDANLDVSVKGRMCVLHYIRVI